MYKFIWYHTEFWLDPKDRRPYTYIIRDFYHKHPILWTSLVIILGFWLHSWLDMKVVSCILTGILIGHLFWGTKYEEGQQEYPEYIGDGHDS